MQSKDLTVRSFQEESASTGQDEENPRIAWQDKKECKEIKHGSQVQKIVWSHHSLENEGIQ